MVLVAAAMTALAAASWVEVRLLNGIPSRQLRPQGRLLHSFALAKLRVSTTESCCAVDRVAKNALARQTTFATPVSAEQEDDVVVSVEVVEVLLLLEVLLLFLQAMRTAVVIKTIVMHNNSVRFIRGDVGCYGVRDFYDGGHRSGG